jgi:hypothetical protein
MEAPPPNGLVQKFASGAPAVQRGWSAGHACDPTETIASLSCDPGNPYVA